MKHILLGLLIVPAIVKRQDTRGGGRGRLARLRWLVELAILPLQKSFVRRVCCSKILVGTFSAGLHRSCPAISPTTDFPQGSSSVLTAKWTVPQAPQRLGSQSARGPLTYSQSVPRVPEDELERPCKPRPGSSYSPWEPSPAVGHRACSPRSAETASGWSSRRSTSCPSRLRPLTVFFWPNCGPS